MPFIRMRNHHLILFLLAYAACAPAVEVPAAAEAVCWTPIARIQNTLGLSNMEHLADGLVLSNAEHVLHLFAGRRNATLDGTTVWLHLPPRDAATNDLRDVTRADFDTLLRPLLIATAAPPPAVQIVLDAGHGGEDSGARTATGTVQEKQIALEITRQVACQLTAAGLQPILTRTGDVTVTLGERMRLAAAQHAQLFISIHANSSPSNLYAMGAETYTLPVAGFNGVAENGHGQTNACPGNRFDGANTQLGFYLHRRYAPLTAMDRGLKRKRLFVLKEAPCPATLIECGFLTNTNDASHLADASYRLKLADAIAAGILDYVKYGATGMAPPPPPPPAPPATNITTGVSITTNALLTAIPATNSATLAPTVTNTPPQPPTAASNPPPSQAGGCTAKGDADQANAAEPAP
jgi:N-acetylmuramoyl-L-alanine amidase